MYVGRLEPEFAYWWIAAVLFATAATLGLWLRGSVEYGA